MKQVEVDTSGKGSVIRVSSLTKSYLVRGKYTTALDNVSFSVEKGEFVAITGESGSGKSTLLNLLACIDDGTSGTISIDGCDISQMGEADAARFRLKSLGIVFQFFYLQPYLTVEQNIMLPGMILNNLSTDERSERAHSLAKMLKIDERLTYKPRKLSGGEMQRVAIARALFNTPLFILADEPTGNLDETNRDTIVDILLQIRSELHTTIVVATHDMELASRADRILRLQRGKLVHENI